MLILEVISPQGVIYEESCESVTLCIPDGENGNGGGSIGIREGHIASLISVAPGEIKAFEGGRLKYSIKTNGGYASVTKERVTVITVGGSK